MQCAAREHQAGQTTRLERLPFTIALRQPPMTHQAAATTIAALMALVIATAPTQAQTVDDIVARHLASRGGAETWRAIESQRTTGTVYTQGIELTMVLISSAAARLVMSVRFGPGSLA